MAADDGFAVRKPLMSHEGEIVQDDSKCCSCTPSWVKTFLIFFTAIILLVAIGLISLGSYLLIMRLRVVSTLIGEVAYINHFLLFTVGVLLIVACIVGFVGVAKKDRNLLITFSLMLGTVLFLQLATSILALCFSELFQEWLASRLQFTMQNNYAASDSNVDNAVDFVQQKFKCCGSLGFRDWKSSIFHNSTDSDFKRRDIFNYGMRVPDSCCIRKVEDCGYLPHPSNVRHQGCIDSIFGGLRDRYYTICVVALTLITVEFIGVILACCYAEALKQQR
ncbi:hypothetical protein P879_08059 [Paragonimus westermani]|uniref:Tetraspanin n=1 Tax=Paragonimus westermani TaxID=34504 RepID=A0A8T0D006_9TREM|nr:hypothetical protein P879_08059 [Paragonimus westermani]